MGKTAKELKVELARALQRVESLERMVKDLSYQAFVDDMTGLPNYRAFCQRLDQLIKEHGRGRPFCLVMVDVDNFKRVNDTFGHQIGDEILRHVATLLHSGSRQVDFVGRYGGEEFCMLLPDTHLKGAADVANRARSAIASAPYGCTQITASFGVCSYSEGMSATELVSAADGALYKAKEDGRNLVVACEEID